MKLVIKVLSAFNFFVSLCFSAVVKPVEQLLIMPVVSHVYSLLRHNLYELATGLLAGFSLSMLFLVFMNVFSINQVCSSYIALFAFYVGSATGSTPALDKHLPRWSLFKEVGCLRSSSLFKNCSGLTYPSYIGLAVGLLYAFPSVTARHDINFALNTYTTYTQWCSPVDGLPAYVWAFLFFWVGVVCTQLTLPIFIDSVKGTQESELQEKTKLATIADLYSDPSSISLHGDLPEHLQN